MIARVLAAFVAATTGLSLCCAQSERRTKSDPLPPPPNGTILGQFCGGDYSGKCSGGMGNWWSPSIAQLRDGTLVVTAEGKSRRNRAHSTPTFIVMWRSTDQGRTFSAAVPLPYLALTSSDSLELAVAGEYLPN